MAETDDLDPSRLAPDTLHVMSDEIERPRPALADRDAQIERLKAAIFGGANYDRALPIGCFVEMALSTEAARQGALARATTAERDLAEARAEVERKDAALEAVIEDWDNLDPDNPEMRIGIARAALAKGGADGDA